MIRRQAQHIVGLLKQLAQGSPDAQAEAATGLERLMTSEVDVLDSFIGRSAMREALATLIQDVNLVCADMENFNTRADATKRLNEACAKALRIAI